MNTNELNMQAGDIQAETVRVWDPWVRTFHWSMVGFFAIAWVTGDEWKELHEIAGYGIAGLVVFRVLWGFIGSTHARFSDFLYRPKIVFGYLKDMLGRQAKRYIGHNPAGGIMILALLTMLFVIAVSGFMMTTDVFWGVEWVEEVHEGVVNITLMLIGLHIAGVVIASFEHGENLVRSMVTGRKRAE